MYIFECEKFGIGEARLRALGQFNLSGARVVEIETVHGFGRTVSLYRYVNNDGARFEASEPNNSTLCRYAIGQFLRRCERIHVARVEVLDTSLSPFAGSLVLNGPGRATPMQRNRTAHGF